MSMADQPIPQSGGFSNISNDLLQSMLERNTKLVDIRTAPEWSQTGVIKNSYLITFFQHNGALNPEFVPRFTEIVATDEPVMLICRSGSRTIPASQAIAQQLGYAEVYNVTGGIISWLREGRAVQTPTFD